MPGGTILATILGTVLPMVIGGVGKAIGAGKKEDESPVTKPGFEDLGSDLQASAQSAVSGPNLSLNKKKPNLGSYSDSLGGGL